VVRDARAVRVVLLLLGRGRAAALLLALLVAPVGAAAQQDIPDPLEPMNRAIFRFNDAADRHVFEPVARFYHNVTPEQVRHSVSNFLANLGSPVVLANDLLQGERDKAGVTFGRFMINSTLGIAGLFDVATRLGYESHEADFGQTLGKYGMKSGPYLMLPLLGPSSLRDTFGRLGDGLADPWNQCCLDTGEETARYGANALSEREQALGVIDDLRRNSLDLYATIRSAYAQRREALIRPGAATSGQQSYDEIFKDPEGKHAK
jgi:phospholipid-binding lipoprotein MlaA